MYLFIFTRMLFVTGKKHFMHSFILTRKNFIYLCFIASDCYRQGRFNLLFIFIAGYLLHARTNLMYLFTLNRVKLVTDKETFRISLYLS